MKVGRGMQLDDMVEVTPAFFRAEARETLQRLLIPVRTLARCGRYMYNSISRMGRTHRVLRILRELPRPIPVTLAESDQFLEVQAEVPGFSEKDLEIFIEPRRLTITGKRETKKEEKKGHTFDLEQGSNEILQVIELPAEVQTEGAVAVLRNGMLMLKVPKHRTAQTVRIEGKTA